MNLDEVLSRFQDARRNGRGYKVRCPSHDDKNPSLSISATDSGKILVKCFAGCDTKNVLDAAGLKYSDLDPAPRQRSENNPIIQEYEYTDEKGAPLFRVCRKQVKEAGFPVKGYDAATGRFEFGLNGARLVLYRLAEVMASDAVDVCEGEKDADNLCAIGRVATTNPFGAEKWRAEYSESLRGKTVCIFQDNDDPGRQHGLMVARSVSPLAKSCKLITLPDMPEKGDVSDYLKKHSKDELLALIESTPEFIDGGEPDAEKKERTERPKRSLIKTMDKIEEEEIDWLWDQRIPRGRLTIFDGDPGVGKSYFALAIAAKLSKGERLPGENRDPEAPQRSIIISVEDGASDTLKPRLRKLGADMPLMGFVDFEELNLTPGMINAKMVDDMLQEFPAALVVFDPIIAFARGKNTDKASDVRQIIGPLALVAARRNVAIVLIRHLNKSTQSKALYRGQGSVDFVAACRSAFAFGQDPNDRRAGSWCKPRRAWPGISRRLSIPSTRTASFVLAASLARRRTTCSAQANHQSNARRSSSTRPSYFSKRPWAMGQSRPMTLKEGRKRRVSLTQRFGGQKRR